MHIYYESSVYKGSIPLCDLCMYVGLLIFALPAPLFSKMGGLGELDADSFDNSEKWIGPVLLSPDGLRKV